MNYELAKRLKQAGFPQLGENYFRCECREATGDETECHCGEQQYAYVPTLEELISEIGGDFYYLTKIITREGNLWEAFQMNGTSGGREDTPLEAVARLFITLNKNKKGK